MRRAVYVCVPGANSASGAPRSASAAHAAAAPFAVAAASLLSSRRALRDCRSRKRRSMSSVCGDMDAAGRQLARECLRQQDAVLECCSLQAGIPQAHTRVPWRRSAHARLHARSATYRILVASQRPRGERRRSACRITPVLRASLRAACVRQQRRHLNALVSLVVVHAGAVAADGGDEPDVFASAALECLARLVTHRVARLARDAHKLHRRGGRNSEQDARAAKLLSPVFALRAPF